MENREILDYKQSLDERIFLTYQVERIGFRRKIINMKFYEYDWSSVCHEGAKFRERAHIIDETGTFVNFPGVVDGAWQEKFKESIAPIAGDTVRIEGFVGGYAYVTWIAQRIHWKDRMNIPQSHDLVFHSLLDRKGEFICPFMVEEQKQTHYKIYKNGYSYDCFTNQTMEFMVGGQVFSSIKEMEKSGKAILFSEGFPCFDAADFATEKRCYRRAVVCRTPQACENMKALLNQHKITCAALSPVYSGHMAEQRPELINALYIVNYDDACSTFSVYSPTQSLSDFVKQDKVKAGEKEPWRFFHKKI